MRTVREWLLGTTAVMCLLAVGCGKPEPPPNPALKVPNVPPAGTTVKQGRELPKKK